MTDKNVGNILELSSKYSEFTKQGSNDGKNTKDNMIKIRHQEDEKNDKKKR